VFKYLGINLHKETRNAFVDRDPEMDPLGEEEFEYAAGDTVVLPEVFYQQLEILKKWDLQRTAELEFKVLPVIAESEVAGVLVNKNRWVGLVDEAKKKYRATSVKIYELFDSVIPQKTLFGVPTFNIGSTKQLLANLKKLGFELSDTEEATLEKYKNRHEVFEQLLKWRGFSKIITSYGEKFLAKINSTTGRLHCEFNQVEANTGRMSSSKPGLQQVPGFDKEDPDSLDFRSCFEARPGYKLITADFSQQELRILADMSGDVTFRKAYTTYDDKGEALDVHRYTASVVFNVPYNRVTKTQRARAKVLNFFLVYGGGAYSLAVGLKIPEEEAQQIIDDYFKRYKGVKRFLDARANAALNKGFSETISGRKRFLTLPPVDDPMFKRARAAVIRKGKNTPIQGSGADVTKQAMVFVYEALRAGGYDATILMVVHDELVVEVREDQAKEVAKIVEREMVRGFSHFFKAIPMCVDAHIGPTWYKD
jgi:DNA polymerase-1